MCIYRQNLFLTSLIFKLYSFPESYCQKKEKVKWMSCYSLSATIIKMLPSWKQKAGPSMTMGKRRKKHYEKNHLLLLKVLCSWSFCQEIQIIHSHLLSVKKKKLAALCSKKAETALFLSTASFTGRRQMHYSCLQFLHLKLDTGMSCQKKLNVTKTCFWSKSETAFAVSQYMHPAGYTTFSFQKYWGYL